MQSQVDHQGVRVECTKRNPGIVRWRSFLVAAVFSRAALVRSASEPNSSSKPRRPLPSITHANGTKHKKATASRQVKGSTPSAGKRAHLLWLFDSFPWSYSPAAWSNWENGVVVRVRVQGSNQAVSFDKIKTTSTTERHAETGVRMRRIKLDCATFFEEHVKNRDDFRGDGCNIEVVFQSKAERRVWSVIPLKVLYDTGKPLFWNARDNGG